MRQDMEVLDTDNKVGLINQTKIYQQTKIPEPEGQEGEREQVSQDNYIEIKKFVNKYREKLNIKSEVQQTMMDKLEGNNQEAARADNIDFDYQSFKISCLHENGGKGIDVNEILDAKLLQKNLKA
jgi:hypothetical protein|tara:strand:+ start:482 stop:856 length:375 start_codon:yes stop_codon:yes gene_type:complete